MSDNEEIDIREPVGKRKRCPFRRGKTSYEFECNGKKCMLWDEVVGVCLFRKYMGGVFKYV